MATKSFFGPSGLSSTRANQISELADRYADKAKSTVSSIQFYSEQMRIPGEEPLMVELGSDSVQVANAVYCLDKIIACNSLMAFLREAIKEKEALTKEAKAWTDEDARTALTNKRNSYQKPIMAKEITEDDVKRGWSIGEQEKYLSLQAECSVIGKFIHKDGAFDYARKDLLEKMKHPRIVKGEGRDITVTEFVPTVDFEFVEGTYANLQATWREKQGELNGMKKKIEDAIEEDRQMKANKYKLELAAYNRFLSDCSMEEENIILHENEVRDRMLEEIKELKIVVPNRLQSIYNELTK